MKKRTYVEMAYAVGYCGELEFVTIPVSDRDPLGIPVEKNLTYFRFFDAVPLGDNCSLETASDYSCRYFLGKRLGYIDLNPEDFFDGMHIQYLDTKGVDKAIFCDSGMRFSNVEPSDKTIEEVIIERVENNFGVLLNSNHFLNGISDILKEHGQEVSVETGESEILLPSVEQYKKTVTKERKESFPLIDYTSSDSQLIRTSELIINGNVGMSLEAIAQPGKDETYFRLPNVEDGVRSLYQEFPYLEPAIKRLKLAIYEHGEDVDVYGALTGNREVRISKNAK